jgi:hypothetical protein
VAPLGPPDANMPEGLSRESRLVRNGSGWDVRDGEESQQAHFDDYEVRVTVSWKADVFTSAAEALSHDRGEDALTLGTVVELFQKDLTARGIDLPEPAEPLADQSWIGVLASTYQDPAPLL